MSPSIFLGLVTHRASRFTEATTDSGLLNSLNREFQALSIPTVLAIHDEDLFDQAGIPESVAEIRASIDAELDTEMKWRAYLDPKASRGRLILEMALRRAVRRVRLAPPWKSVPSVSDPGPRMLRRLGNIEIAHLNLLRQAEIASTTWALIVEDDAHCADIPGLAADLATFMISLSPQDQPKYVNISRSFSTESLGTSHLLSLIGSWGQGANIALLSSAKPITNTVCAILYRGSYLPALNARLGSIPMSPVIPIDWKLNKALMLEWNDGNLTAGDCWNVEPAPIIQGSMSGESEA